MDRSNHYESAIEAYLRANGLCYIAVDEAKRTMLDAEPVKNLDFIVYGDQGAKLLVDVKGRRFPGGPPDRPRRVWESWVEIDDITGLIRWEERFGPDYRGLIVFAYDLQSNVELPPDTPDIWSWRDRRYLLRAIRAVEYRQHMKVRSPKWQTVDLPHQRFREIVRPFSDYLRSFPVHVVKAMA
jgi:hypothetical protein